ncbi:MAG: hypothetical protein CMH54_05025 [Myxococcales bacterium]|nr:hypothetical protein [Myxococcales bacterium]|tara:strand:+ start:1772 stop:2308 length:537 start_codon:yes stop_codon:yes gene_type:complete
MTVMNEVERKACEDRIAIVLDELAIEFTIDHHTAVFTVEEAKAVRGEWAGAHLKNLFLCDRKKERFWLIVALEHKVVRLRELGNAVGEPRGLRFANVDHLQEMLGVQAGAVTPFALMNESAEDVNVLLDQDILQYDQVNAHPLHNMATLRLTSNDLLRFMEAQGATVTQVHFAEPAHD